MNYKSDLELSLKTILHSCPNRYSTEIYISITKETEIQYWNKETRLIQQSVSKCAAVRVNNNQRMGFSYTTDISVSGLQKSINYAYFISSLSSSDPCNYLVNPVNYEYNNLHILSYVDKTSIIDKINLCRKVEEIALAYHKRIQGVERIIYNDQISKIFIFNSLGLEAKGNSSFCGLRTYIVAHEHDKRNMGISRGFSVNPLTLDTTSLGSKASQLALLTQEKQLIQDQSPQIVFDPWVSANFIFLIALSLSAKKVQSGKSPFTDLIGHKIASINVSIIDFGCLPNGPGSCEIDTEGVPTQRTILIDRGILRSYLHSTYTAFKNSTHSTGNAVRPTFKDQPFPGITNCYFNPGNTTPEEILSGIENGIYVYDIMGMHTSNTITGEFSVTIIGRQIRRGEMGLVIRNVILSGTIMDFLNGIEQIGNDLQFFSLNSSGFCGSPTIQVKNLMISA